ncbi:MAG: hypothetical protein BroJett018_03080 [Chloroflexota bacterium]|nr:hypothetical protein [Chloroflexota bacterium]NOG61897.1 hypothetical protein [Chloroflexota bacterium]GIK62514.1 MAG: hypothetical protein BroJett018_03080 [Chloroflexota bacterium]
MLKRWRLPQDNFPDDTETRAFQHYKDGKQPPHFHFPGWRLGNWKPIAAATLFVAIVIITAILVFLWSEPRERFVVVTSASTVPADLPSIPVGGDFPTDAAQQFIRIPARIEDTLQSGQRRGYTFVVKPGFTWQITAVANDSLLDPVLSLYGPDGIIMDFNDNATENETSAQITLTVQQEGIYAVLLEGANGSSGDYILYVPVPD